MDRLGPRESKGLGTPVMSAIHPLKTLLFFRRFGRCNVFVPNELHYGPEGPTLPNSNPNPNTNNRYHNLKPYSKAKLNTNFNLNLTHTLTLIRTERVFPYINPNPNPDLILIIQKGGENFMWRVQKCLIDAGFTCFNGKQVQCRIYFACLFEPVFVHLNLFLVRDLYMIYQTLILIFTLILILTSPRFLLAEIGAVGKCQDYECTNIWRKLHV